MRGFFLTVILICPGHVARMPFAILHSPKQSKPLQSQLRRMNLTGLTLSVGPTPRPTTVALLGQLSYRSRPTDYACRCPFSAQRREHPRHRSRRRHRLPHSPACRAHSSHLDSGHRYLAGDVCRALCITAQGGHGRRQRQRDHASSRHGASNHRCHARGRLHSRVFHHGTADHPGAGGRYHAGVEAAAGARWRCGNRHLGL